MGIRARPDKISLFVSFSRNQKVTTYDQITYKYKGINVSYKSIIILYIHRSLGQSFEESIITQF